jgi:hypothetical protein
MKSFQKEFKSINIYYDFFSRNNIEYEESWNNDILLDKNCENRNYNGIINISNTEENYSNPIDKINNYQATEVRLPYIPHRLSDVSVSKANTHQDNIEKFKCSLERKHNQKQDQKFEKINKSIEKERKFLFNKLRKLIN